METSTIVTIIIAASTSLVAFAFAYGISRGEVAAMKEQIETLKKQIGTMPTGEGCNLRHSQIAVDMSRIQKTLDTIVESQKEQHDLLIQLMTGRTS